MGVCKDEEGYFILDSRNAKVELVFKGEVVTHFKSAYDILEAHWYKNYSHIIVDNPCIVIDKRSKSFKSLKNQIREQSVKPKEIKC